MPVFYGTPLQPGVAIAAAARLIEQYGLPVLSSERLRRLGERQRRAGMEMPENEQIVLAAAQIQPGFLPLRVAGLEVVGLALGGNPAEPAAADVPAVAGLGDEFWNALEEDEIVIVDGDRGRVYVGPDAATLARYQTPLRSARRIFLEGVHLPARTRSDRRRVPVFAPAPTLAAVEEAMANGADGLWIPPDSSLLDDGARAGGALARLEEAAGIAGGQPLIIGAGPHTPAAPVLAQAAAWSPLHLALETLAGAKMWRARLDAAEADLDSRELAFGRVMLEAWLPAGEEEATLPDGLDGFAGVLVADPGGDSQMACLLPIISLAQHTGRPATLLLPEQWRPEQVVDLIGVGFSRLIAQAGAIAAAKDAVREA